MLFLPIFRISQNFLRARDYTVFLKRAVGALEKIFLRKGLTVGAPTCILGHVNRTGATLPDRLTGAASRIIAGVGRPV